MNGELVGHWDLTAKGHQTFRYAQTWLDSEATRPLSLSMSLRPANLRYADERVSAFFDNLLPDSQDIRRRIQARFHTSSTNAFDLLAEIGRDCIGAVQLLAPDDEPKNIKRIEGRPLSDKKIAELLRTTVSAPALGQQEDDLFRISLAGAQEKTALLRHQSRWCLPSGATPSTHIFKLPLGRVSNFNVDLSTSVENEWLCSEIIRAYGVPIANCEIANFDGQSVLIVERFDRRKAGNGKWWLRLPQEDMCQATGTELSKKYEADGGPGIREIMSLLLGARDPIVDRRLFFKAQILFWVLCAPDGHAKNFSVSIGPRGEFSLTPFYDVISAYPVLGRRKNQMPPDKLKMAMAVRGKSRHYNWSKILRRHWVETARSCDFSDFIDSVIAEIIDGTPQAIHNVTRLLPPRFPAAVADSILKGVERAVKQLA